MKDSNIEAFHNEKSKMAVYFVIGFLGLLGIAMLIAFFDSLSNIDGDAIFLLVLGSALVAFAVLFYRYSFIAQYALTGREFRIRNLFGLKAIPYQEITSLGTFSNTFRPKTSRGTTMSPITIHHLVINQRSGKKKTCTLPSFTANDGMLESLSRRSGITIEKLPDKVEKGLENN